VLPDVHRPIELHVWGVLPEQPFAFGEHSPVQAPFTQARPGQSPLSLHWQQPDPHVPLEQVTAQAPPSQRALPYIGAWQALPGAHRPLALQVWGVFPEQPLAVGEHSPAQAPDTQARPGQSAWLSHWQQPEPHMPFGQVTAQVPPSQRTLPLAGDWQVLPDTHRPAASQVRGVVPEHERVLGLHSPVHWPPPLHTNGQVSTVSQVPMALHSCRRAPSQRLVVGTQDPAQLPLEQRFWQAASARQRPSWSQR
jgi:hypothetical protein